MGLPNFLCIGAQKAGTSTLHDILKQHPDIYLPKTKEAHFFDQEERYTKGIEWWLNEFFHEYNEEKVVGTITPEYLYFEEVAERIAKDIGKDVKIIVLLRHPVDRAYSHYLMSQRRGFEEKSFGQAIELEDKRISIDEFHRNHFSYLARGLYAKQLKNIFKYLNKDNTKVYIFETDFLQNRTVMIKDILDFLGLNNDLNIKINLKSNPSSKPQFTFIRSLVYKKGDLLSLIGRVIIPNKKLRWKFKDWIDKKNLKSFKYKNLSSDFKKTLIKNYFLDDINELEKMLNRDLTIWKK